MKFTHDELTVLAEKWLLKRCGFAFRELSTDCGEIPDAIGFKECESILIECKTSRQDFIADRKKQFRAIPAAGVGRVRFYLCEKGLIMPEDLPPKWGLIWVYESGQVRQKVGPKGDVWSKGSKFWFNKINVAGEMSLMYRALRRMQIHGVLPLIYTYPQ